jgi:sugar lactone lactonase YvrE
MPKIALIALICACVLCCASEALSQAVNLGSVDIGSSATSAVTLTIANSTTLTGVSVLTQGSPNLDFTDGGNDTCTVSQSYSANATCTVNVTFSPKFVGSRYGAVVLYDANGVVATAYLQGTGMGPQLNFLPPAQTTIGNQFTRATGVAVDGAGNLYVSDGERILKETLSNGAYTQSVIPTSGLGLAAGIAIDGAGNLYVAYYGSAVTGGEVLELSPSNGSYVQQVIASGLINPAGVAVDAAGNVYVAEAIEGSVLKETLTASGYTQSIIAELGFGFGNEAPVAVDSGGNVLVVGGDYIYVETPTSSGYKTNRLKTPLEGANGIAVDGSGNVYLSYYPYYVVKLSFDGKLVQSTVLATVNEPQGFAFDGAGNLYVATTPSPHPSAIVELGFGRAPLLSFGNVPYGSPVSARKQTLTVENIGNQPLELLVLQSGDNPALNGDFVLGKTASSGCPIVAASASSPGILANGDSCGYTLTFAPTQLGPARGSLVLTDNNLNAAGPQYATQTAAAYASEVQASQHITITSVPKTLLYGHSPIAIAATGGDSGNPVTFTVGPAKLNGNRLKITGAGTVKVTANQAGNTDYLAATPLSFAFNVEKALLTVSAEDAKRSYGKPNPDFKYRVEGFVNGDTAAKAYHGAPSLTTAATVKSLPGKYDIATRIGSLSSSNYKFALDGATLTVESLGTAKAPKIAPTTGTFKESVTVTMTDATPGAVIHYTTNGSEPKDTSSEYKNSLSLTATTTVKAIAVAPGYTSSPVSSSTYTISD